MVASRKLVEIANLFPVCKFKDKDHLKITKVHMLLIIRYIAVRVVLKELMKTELLDFQ